MSIFSKWLKKPAGSSKSIGNQIYNAFVRLPATAIASIYSPSAARAVAGRSTYINTRQGFRNLTFGSRAAVAIFGGAAALGAFAPAAAAPVGSTAIGPTGSLITLGTPGGAVIPGTASVLSLGTPGGAVVSSAAVNSIWAAPVPAAAAIPTISGTIAAANATGSGGSTLASVTGWAGLWKTLTGGNGGNGGALDLPASNPADVAGGTNIGITTPGQAGDLTQVPLGDLAGMNPIMAGAGGSTAGSFIIPVMIISALAFFLWKSSKK